MLLDRISRNLKSPLVEKIHFVKQATFMCATSVGMKRENPNHPVEMGCDIHSIDRVYLRHIVKPKSKLQYDIFSYPFLYIPVNQNNDCLHWFGVVVIHPGDVLLPQEESLTGYIVLDPAGCNAKLADESGVRWFLNHLWKYRRSAAEPYSVTADKIEKTGQDSGPFDDDENFMQLHINPEEFIGQKDACSCGIFTCLYALDFLCTQTTKEYKLLDMDRIGTDPSGMMASYYIPSNYNILGLLKPNRDDATFHANGEYERALSYRFRQEFTFFCDELHGMFAYDGPNQSKSQKEEIMNKRNERLAQLPPFPQYILDRLMSVDNTGYHASNNGDELGVPPAQGHFGQDIETANALASLRNPPDNPAKPIDGDAAEGTIAAPKSLRKVMLREAQSLQDGSADEDENTDANGDEEFQQEDDTTDTEESTALTDKKPASKTLLKMDLINRGKAMKQLRVIEESSEDDTSSSESTAVPGKQPPFIGTTSTASNKDIKNVNAKDMKDSSNNEHLLRPRPQLPLAGKRKSDSSKHSNVPRKKPKSQESQRLPRQQPLKLDRAKVLTETELWQKYGKWNDDDYDDTQRSSNLWFQIMSKKLEMPRTERECDEEYRDAIKEAKKSFKRNLITENEFKKRKMVAHAIARHKKKAVKDLKQEAIIAQFKSVKEMKYVKSQTGHGAGYYVAKVGDEKKLCAFMPDWVQTNFHEDAVHSVREPGEREDMFVDVTKYDVVVQLSDDRPIQRARYIIPAPKYTYDGKNNIIEHLTVKKEPYFQGMVKGGALIKLSMADMEANFTPAYIETVIRMGSKNTRKFVRLPPGAPNPGGKIPPGLASPDAPKVKYQQNDAATCLLSSAASALDYIGRNVLGNHVGIVEAASEIQNVAKRTIGKQLFENNWSLLKKQIQIKIGFLLPKKLNRWFNPNLDKSLYPTVVQLMAKDGGVEHAVTIVGEWIFDSNFQEALPLSTHALDFLCAPDGEENVQGWFQEVYHGFRFEEDKNKKKKVFYENNK
jgi:hypothetical protein